MKRLISLTLIFSLCLSFTSFAYVKSAPEPKDVGKSVAELNGYTEEEWAKLTDNNLEYSEIQERIHNFNLSLSTGWDQYQNSMNEIKGSANIMSAAKKDAQDNYNKAKGTPMEKTMLGIVTVAKMFESSFNSTYQKMQKNSMYNAPLRKAERQLTSAVEQIMIGYCSVRANKKTLENMVQMYHESLKAYEALASVGMATSTDILDAQAGYLSAVSSLASLTTTEQQLYNQLITLCGWKLGDVVNVSEVPAPDMNKIAAYNPETDSDTAILRSSALRELWESDHSRSSTGLELMNDIDSQMKANIKANMQTLYAEVLAAKADYEGAQAGYESARIARDAANTQYQLGLTSKAQYLGVMIKALQGEAAMVTARDNLQIAIQKYDAAVDGDCSTE